ncbi:ABC transporter substrate-binding protein [Phytohabitans aurantiacus]|uniref:ABC transporter substrate-binding protein n=1 Tax=Phytohabitans aurantiacus TaxID=3016789 RepID=A0ABQ5QQD5_9ACTN|nr:ABC transporter substrate-binding protein [Phytohabitans aurantiacus]
MLGAGALLGANVLGMSIGSDAQAAPAEGAPAEGGGQEEKKSLDELYADALKEGGQLIVYAGGDTPTQQDGTKAAFLSRFPDMKLTIVVDYSKYHDARIDNQLATGTLVPDVVQLQTLQDFTRWKKAGVLRPYKPAGFSAVHKGLKDHDGAWVAIAVIAFSYVYNVAAVGGAPPASPLDLVAPRWKGAIASSYPHDDDAVLYLYKLYTEAYGWDWVAKLAAQNVQFARGSNSPAVAVTAGQKAVGVGTSGTPITSPTATTRWVVPPGDHPFMSWGQRAAILAGAKHKAAAKLYMNWAISKPVQQNSFNGWSVRTDVTPPSGLKPIWKYRNGHLDGFPRFMADRADVERWKQTFALYFGEVQGAPTPGSLGLHPGAAA